MRSVRDGRVGRVGGGRVFSVVENVAGSLFGFFDCFFVGDFGIDVARVGRCVGICFVHMSLLFLLFCGIF